MAELKTRIVLRNDSKTNWEAANTAKLADNGPGLILLKGEIGIEFNPAPVQGQENVPEIKVKIGDGFTRWDELPYATKTPAEIDSLINSITSKLGTIPAIKDDEGNDITTIIGYINQKTKGVATSGNITAIEGRLDVLEAIEHHTHTNKEELDKINDGDVAKWNDAANQINNLEIPTGSTVYQNTNLANIAKEGLNNGDFAIITSVINGDKKSRTAYVWDATIPVYELNEDGSFKLDDNNEKIIKSHGDWVAFDGNYSANNIYTSSDIKLAGNFTSIGNYQKDDVIDAGTSLADILSTMMQAPLATSKTNPTATITNITTNYANTAEVGNTYTLPTARLTVTTGKYTCDGKDDFDTGVEYAAESIKLAYKNLNETDTKKYVKNSTKIEDTSSVKYIDLAPGSYNYENTDNSGNVITTGILKDSTDKDRYVFKASASHSAADKTAVNNLGQSTDTKIAANTNMSITDLTVDCYGYRKMFMGCSATLPTTEAELNTTIRGLRNWKDKNFKENERVNGWAVSTGTKNVAVPAGTKYVIIAVPASRTISAVLDNNASDQNVVGSFVNNKFSTKVTGANNYSAIDYNVYYAYYGANGSSSANILKVTVA